MTVLLVVNRASGTGRAARLAARFTRALDAAGVRHHACDPRDPGPTGTDRTAFLRRFRAVVLIGGDGTLHHLLPGLCDAGTPVYHAPAGTENLFAREFGMTAEPDALVRALERGRTSEVDTGQIDVGAGQPRAMALMASFGPDAGVIARLHAARGRAAGHAMYAGPVLAEITHPRLAHVSVRVDGDEIVTDGHGLLVVSNCRQYARRLNPAPDADMTDGLLDAVFLPARTTAGLLLWGARCALGEHITSPGAVLARGREVHVTCNADTPVQCDGEAAGWVRRDQEARMGISERTMQVLLP